MKRATTRKTKHSASVGSSQRPSPVQEKKGKKTLVLRKYLRAADGQKKVVISPEQEELGPRMVKVRRVGNSLGMVIPKEVALAIGAVEGSVFYLSKAPNRCAFLTPTDPDFEKAMAIAREGMKQYRETLRELAK